MSLFHFIVHHSCTYALLSTLRCLFSGRPFVNTIRPSHFLACQLSPSLNVILSKQIRFDVSLAHGDIGPQCQQGVRQRRTLVLRALTSSLTGLQHTSKTLWLIPWGNSPALTLASETAEGETAAARTVLSKDFFEGKKMKEVNSPVIQESLHKWQSRDEARHMDALWSICHHFYCNQTTESSEGGGQADSFSTDGLDSQTWVGKQSQRPLQDLRMFAPLSQGCIGTGKLDRTGP